MTDAYDELDWTDAEIRAELRNLVEHRGLMAWSHEGGRYIVHWTTMNEPTEPVETRHAVMTGPQIRAFVLGIDAGMGWVRRLSDDVQQRDGSVPAPEHAEMAR